MDAPLFLPDCSRTPVLFREVSNSELIWTTSQVIRFQLAREIAYVIQAVLKGFCSG